MNHEILDRPITDDIIAVSADAIISIDEQQRIIRFNHGAEQIFGYGSDEVLGLSLDVLIPHPFRKAHRHHVDEFGKEQIPARHMAEHREITGLRKSGEEFKAEVSISKTRDSEGEAVYTATLRDITERLHEEHTRIAKASAAVRAREDMLSVVSHDLRNPIATMDFSAALIMELLNTSRDPPNIVPYLKTIRRSAQRAIELLNNLTDLTRIDSGHFTVRPEAHSISQLLDCIIPDLELIAQDKNIRIEKSYSSHGELVLADEARITQVLSNLVGNAIKFTPSGGLINISARQTDGFVDISVSDTGTGIPQQELPKIFDRFWQQAETARLGAGLGLFIAKNIVEAHNGTIWASSELGHGTTFTFTLPQPPATRLRVDG